MNRNKIFCLILTFLIISITFLYISSCISSDADSNIQDIFYDDITEYLYIANEEGIDVYNTHNFPYNEMEKIGSYSLPNIKEIRAWYDRLYVAVENYGFYELDVSDVNYIHETNSYYIANHGNTGLDLYPDSGIGLANKDLGVYFYDTDSGELIGQ